MITSRLSGGLGNQMFQYAAGRSLALRNCTDLHLDRRWFGHQTQREVRTRRSYELGAFSLPTGTEVPMARGWGGRRGVSQRNDDERLLSEAYFSFDQSVLDAPDGTVLDGYWQTERYFSDHASTIRSDFRFRTTPHPQTARLLDVIGATTSIALHVRRGDYVVDPHTSAFHGTVAQTHYLRAVEDLAAHLNSDAQLFVFSDDIRWCQEHLRFPLSTTYVDHNSGRRSYEDLWLMSVCRHHVLANSSFSWWGAWLAEHPDQQVIAPDPWFADPSIDTSDLLPTRWRSLAIAK